MYTIRLFFSDWIGIIELNEGSIAQLVEHLPYKQNVSGSSPFTPNKVIHWIIQIVSHPI